MGLVRTTLIDSTTLEALGGEKLFDENVYLSYLKNLLLYEEKGDGLGCIHCNQAKVSKGIAKNNFRVPSSNSELHILKEGEGDNIKISLSPKGYHTLKKEGVYFLLVEDTARKEALLKEEKAVSKKAAPPITPAQ